jgi:hypothetical protein
VTTGALLKRGERLRFLISILDRAEIGELDEAAVGERDRRIGELRDIAGIAEHADGLFAAGDLATAGAEVDIGAAQLLAHRKRGDAISIQLVRVELDTHFAIGAAIAVDAADARLALKGALDRIVDEP